MSLFQAYKYFLLIELGDWNLLYTFIRILDVTLGDLDFWILLLSCTIWKTGFLDFFFIFWVSFTHISAQNSDWNLKFGMFWSFNFFSAIAFPPLPAKSWKSGFMDSFSYWVFLRTHLHFKLCLRFEIWYNLKDFEFWPILHSLTALKK